MTIEDTSVRTMIVHVGFEVGIKEMKQVHHKWRIFPNPASGKFYITDLETGNGKVEIMDINGKILYARNLKGEKELAIETNLASDKSYILKVTDYDTKKISTSLFIKR